MKPQQSARSKQVSTQKGKRIMGTDIHHTFQARANAQQWIEIPSRYEGNRHYALFAILADVRNGYGFAGIKTGEPVQPISAPRGLPADLPEGDYGDHSQSWLLGSEILAWRAAHAGKPTLKTGVLDRKEYERWDHIAPPSAYSGDVWGQQVVTVNDNAIEMVRTPHWTHVRCHWEEKPADECAYFFDEVARLVGEHGEVRFVFGFDS